MQKGDVIDALGQMRKQIADPFAALAVLLKLPARLDDASLVLDATAARRFYFDRLIVHADHRRLIVKGVDVAGPTVHEQKDDTLGFGLEVRLLRGERIGKLRDTVGRHSL